MFVVSLTRGGEWDSVAVSIVLSARTIYRCFKINKVDTTKIFDIRLNSSLKNQNTIRF